MIKFFFNFVNVSLVFIFLSLFFQIKCSFLVFPLKALKRNNIYLNFEDKEISKYLEKDFNAEKLLKEWHIKSYYSEIKSSEPELTTILELSTNIYTFKTVIDEKYETKPYINIFNKSNTLEFTSKITTLEMFNKIILKGSASEIFKFPIYNNLSDSNPKYLNERMDLEIEAKVDKENNITADDIKISNLKHSFSFIFGLQLFNDGAEDILFQILKKKNIIDSYDYCVEFYNNPKINKNSEEDEIGRLIFGKFEEIYDTNKYPSQYLRKTKLIDYTGVVVQSILMSEINIHQPEKKLIPVSKKVITRINFAQNLFVSDVDYKRMIKNEFFDLYKNICIYETSSSYYEKTTSPYGIYSCDPSIKNYKNNFPVLEMYSNDLNFTFEFGFDDLFKEYFGKIYFLVALPEFLTLDFEIGTIFLKKYKLFLNADKREAAFYFNYDKPKENINNNSFKAIKIIIIIVIVSIMFYFGYVYGKKFTQKRKIRANELEDGYDYININNNKNELVNK